MSQALLEYKPVKIDQVLSFIFNHCLGEDSYLKILYTLVVPRKRCV